MGIILWGIISLWEYATSACSQQRSQEESLLLELRPPRHRWHPATPAKHPPQHSARSPCWAGEFDPERVPGLLEPCCPGRSPGALLRDRSGGKCPGASAAEEGLCSPAAASGPAAVFTRLPSFPASPGSRQGWEQEAHGPRTPDLDFSLSSSPPGQQVCPDGVSP